MTNNKIKNHKAIIENIVCTKAIKETYKLTCIFMLTLNKLYPKQFYKAKVKEWWDTYESTTKAVNQYFDEGIYDFKMEKIMEKYHINFNLCVIIVKKFVKGISAKGMEILSSNVRLMLIHSIWQYGFGAARCADVLLAMLQSDFENPEEEIKRFGIDYEMPKNTLIDFANFKKKKEYKPTLSEIQQASEGLKAFNAYQQEMKEGIK